MITASSYIIDFNAAYANKIRLVQGERSGRILQFYLKYSGIAIDLTDKIVILSGKKSDGTVLFIPCTINSTPTTGVVTCAVNSQFVAAVGDLELQITIYAQGETGTTTSATSTSLYDTTKTFAENAFAGNWLYIVSGTGAGQTRLIASNTATQIVTSTAWTTNPTAGSIYAVVEEESCSFPFWASVTESLNIEDQIESSSDFSSLQAAITTAAGLDAAALHKAGDETITGYKSVPTPTSAAHIANKSYVDSDWMPVSETWAYASATTITVPTGAVTRYQRFDKIKFTQSGSVKYGIVLVVADTLLTLLTSATYPVTNVTISSVSISRKATPFGFPTSREAWRQTYALASNVTVTEGTQGYFLDDNNRVECSLFAAAVGSYVQNTQVLFTLPVNFRPARKQFGQSWYQRAAESTSANCADIAIDTNGEVKIYCPSAEAQIQYVRMQLIFYI